MTVGRVVIIGAGQAGGWVVRTLRDEGYRGEIILVGDEPYAPYERPPLSKEILLGDATIDDLTLMSADELLSLSVKTYLGQRVARVDREGKQILLEAIDERLPYDVLVMCTGGRARQAPVPVSGDVHIHMLRTLDDALCLRAAIASRPGHVLVIGGGWIGLEVAASARQMGCEVTLVERAERLCQRSITPDVSVALHDIHQKHGNQVVLGGEVRALKARPGADGIDAVLSNGHTLSASHVVMAAGLIANDELASDAGLLCRNGVLVDAQCRSSDPAIYAAGDVAVVETAIDGVHMRLESWQNAQDQGMAVARAILGQPISYRPTPILWSQQFDQFIQIAGHVDRFVQTVVRAVRGKGSMRFYLDGEEIVRGVIGMNAGRDWRFARQLVEQNARVSAATLADSEQPLKRLVPSMAENVI